MKIHHRISAAAISHVCFVVVDVVLSDQGQLSFPLSLNLRLIMSPPVILKFIAAKLLSGQKLDVKYN